MYPRIRQTLALGAVFAALAGCSTEPTRAPNTVAGAPSGPSVVAGTSEASADAPDATTARAARSPLPQRTFGAPITATASTPLIALAEDPAGYTGKTVRTEGVVTAVCKSMGCWMEIGDAKSQVHIKMAGHSFFVPKTSDGHRAIVQGEVIAPDGNTCGDSCKSHNEPGSGAMAKVELLATGVEFVD